MATFGRGVWETDLLTTSNTGYNTRNITSNTTWDSEHSLNMDLRIKSGNRLTITGTLSMPKGGKIFVEKDAELFVISGGKITNGCDEMWDGIYLIGNGSNHQYELSGYRDQAYLYIDGGTIEHAKDAIRMWDGSSTSTTGGVIVARNANFLNNWRSTEFMTYHGFSPYGGGPVGNLSYYRQCHFEVNDDFRLDRFACHLSFWDVDGIDIQACDFLFTNSAITGSNRKSAIVSIDANYEVEGYCSGIVYPCSPWQFGSMTGFYRAIDVSNSSSTRNIVVDRTRFSENYMGIYARSVDNMRVTRCNFDLGNYAWSSYSYGIYQRDQTDFIIEANVFEKTSGSKPYPYGIYTYNSGADPNQIYGNAFSNVYYGNYASWLNRDANSPYNGLAYLCNDNDNNTYDFYVANHSGTVNEGIRIYQASPQGAGNSFSYHTSPTGSDFRNTSDWPVNYYCAPGTCPSNTTNVWTMNASNDHTCPVNYPPVDNPYEEEERLRGLEKAVADLESRHKSLVEEARELEKALERENPVLAESDRKDREAEISQRYAEAGQLLNKAIIMALGDTGSLRDQQLRSLWAQKPSLHGKLSLLESYLEHGELADAKQVLAQIREHTGQRSEEEIGNLVSFKKMQILHRKTGTLPFEISQADLNKLEHWAEEDSWLAGTESRAWLSFWFDYEFEVEDAHDEPMEPVAAHFTTDNAIRIYPVPASDFIIVHYQIPQSNRETLATLDIMNLNGQRIKSAVLNAQEGKHQVSVDELAAGMYLYAVRLNGKLVGQGKLSVYR
ncbi:MAG: T9SS type A sorting domain-containing protein [Bacteroidia bacterium]